MTGHGRDDEPRRALAEQVDRRRARDRQPDERAEARVRGGRPPRGSTPRARRRGRRPTRPGPRRAGRARRPRGRTPGPAAPGRGRATAGRPRRRGRRARRRRCRRGPASPRRRAGSGRRRPASPAGRASPTSSSSPTTPISGVGAIAPARRLVVERDVAAGDRQPEGAARVGEAADALGELPEGLGPGRVAVVQAVRHAERPRAGDRDVAGRLGDAHRRAEPRIDRADRLVRVGRGDERLRRALDPDHRRAVAGSLDRVRLDGRVVLLVDRRGGWRGWPSRAGRRGRRPGPCPAPAGRPLRRLGSGAPGAGAWRRRTGAAATRSWTIASLVRAAAGIRASSAPSSATIAMSPSAVTRPMTATGRPQRSQTARTASQRSGSTIASIRSWDSLIRTSNGSIPGSRRGIAASSIRIPVPARSAVSDVAQVIPPAPRSWRPDDEPRRGSARATPR